MSDAFPALFALLIRAAIAAGGAAIAKGKGRNAVVWFIVCFIFSWLGLIVIALMPRSRNASPAADSTLKLVPPPATYDSEKWANLLASDRALAEGVERLRAYGERYVTELASILLTHEGKQDTGPIVEEL